jgi:hypothetical protein
VKKLSFLIIIITLIWADGSMIPPPYHEIYSADQVALIKILPDSEELSILVKFSYKVDYDGFAWVIPFPSLPSIGEIDDSIFLNLSMLSATYKTYGGCGSYFDGGYHYGNDYFKVISYQTIGFLQTVLIQTNSPDTLVNFLLNNGYQLPAGMRDMFQDYISREWQYFFIAKVDTNTYNPENNVGIRFKFFTSEIVYPMKISSLTSSDGISLYLYIIGQHKMFFDGAELLYANQISKDELKAIYEDLPALFNYIKEGDYITKLHRYYERHQDMSSDIIIYQSPDDTEYRKEEEPEWYMGVSNSILFPFILFCLLTIVMRIKRKMIILKL